MFKKKVGKIWATVIVIILFVGGLFSWLTYYWALKDENKEWYETQYIQKEFKGVILEIGNYSYNSNFEKEFISLTFSTDDTLEPKVHYGMLSFKKEPLLKSFIRVGDSIFKTKGRKEMTFRNMNGQTKIFQLPIDIK